MLLISHVFPPVNRMAKVNTFNVNIDRLRRYVTSTPILASKPDALWDKWKRSIPDEFHTPSMEGMFKKKWYCSLENEDPWHAAKKDI